MGASIHQANFLLSANIFALFDAAAHSANDTNCPLETIEWYVVDQDDCQDRRFRQARFPALNGSRALHTISMPMLCKGIMAAASLPTKFNTTLIEELTGYVTANRQRLKDLAAWFGQPPSDKALSTRLALLCDAIDAATSIDAVGFNVELTHFFCREWLQRTASVTSLTTFYRENQIATIEMLARVQANLIENSTGAIAVGTTEHQWSYWLLSADGDRRPATLLPGPAQVVELGSINVMFAKVIANLDATVLSVIPGVLADTVGDVVLRGVTSSSQYWRSQSTVAAAASITKAVYRRDSATDLVGRPGTFELPIEQCPAWLLDEEVDGFRSGIYSVVVYWLIGQSSAPRWSRPETVGV